MNEHAGHVIIKKHTSTTRSYQQIMCSNLFTSLQFPQRFAYLAFVGCSLTLERLQSLEAMAEPAPPARRRTGKSAIVVAQAKDEKPDDDAPSEVSTMCGDAASMPEFLCDRCDEMENQLIFLVQRLTWPHAWNSSIGLIRLQLVSP